MQFEGSRWEFVWHYKDMERYEKAARAQLDKKRAAAAKAKANAKKKARAKVAAKKAQMLKDNWRNSGLVRINGPAEIHVIVRELCVVNNFKSTTCKYGRNDLTNH